MTIAWCYLQYIDVCNYVRIHKHTGEVQRAGVF